MARRNNKKQNRGDPEAKTSELSRPDGRQDLQSAGKPQVAGSDALSTSASMPGALKEHFEKLIDRAKRERKPRELKWLRNLRTYRGDALSEKECEDPNARDTLERLRVARQKSLTAKATLGDSVYKGNAVPFVLAWHQLFAEQIRMQEVNPDEVLSQLSRAVQEDLTSGKAAYRLRDSLEDGAVWGEYWLHGVVTVGGDGIPVGCIETITPWEMFVDTGNEDDVAKAEYVMRRRRLTPFEVWRIAEQFPDGFDIPAVRRAVAQASTRGDDASLDSPSWMESGRLTTDTIDWWEVWAKVPESILRQGDGEADPLDVDNSTEIERYIDVVAYFSGGDPVGFLVDPGPWPYARFVWDVERAESHPAGVCDSLGDTQRILSQFVRKWIANIDAASVLTLAGKREMFRQDAEDIINGGVRWIDLDPDARDVREALQQVHIDPMITGVTDVIEMLLMFADLESNIPRILQGQQPHQEQTAFEIRNRLMAAGKYLGEVVRRHDEAIVWAVGWVLYVMALTGQIDNEAMVQVQAKGFTSFSDLVQKIDGLLRLVQMGSSAPEVGELLNFEWIMRQVAQAEDIDTSQAFLSQEVRDAKAQAQAESEERQLELARVQADVEAKQARASRDAAHADAVRERGTLDRARFIKDVEDTHHNQQQRQLQGDMRL